MNYKICLIGAKDTTISVAKHMIDNICNIDCIITVDENKINTKNISGFSSIDSFATEKDIFLFKVQSYSMNDATTKSFFVNNEFDIGICLGWQRLIPIDVLERFKFGIFGFHGSCAYLPYGRGRSPLNWSIINGDERFILNMFKYDEKADSPNVYQNIMFQINPFDTIRTLQFKNLLCCYEMISNLIIDYKNNCININTSTKDFDYLYPKRNPKDGKIDFKQKTKDIYNLIRGVTKPFPGAFCYCNKSTDTVTVWDASPFDNILNFSKYTPGEVIEIFDNMPVVRTLDGSILIKEYESSITLIKGDILK